MLPETSKKETTAEESTRIYKIGAVARKLGIAVGTVRLYEARGLILVQRTSTKQRYYDDSDIQRLACIQKLIKRHGLNIEGICRLAALLPCWNIHECPDDLVKQCRAIRWSNKPCWATRSGGCKNFDTQTCRSCSVYTAMSAASLKKSFTPV